MNAAQRKALTETVATALASSGGKAGLIMQGEDGEFYIARPGLFATAHRVSDLIQQMSTAKDAGAGLLSAFLPELDARTQEKLLGLIALIGTVVGQ